jgi:ubiquinone/menaquinone biosynthesis C-methylase UbiE
VNPRVHRDEHQRWQGRSVNEASGFSKEIFDWQIQVIEPGSSDSAPDQLRTLLSFGPAARRALAGVMPGTKLTLGVEIDSNGVITGATLPPGFAAAAKEAGLQLRVELVTDGYDKRHVDFAKIHGVQEEDLRLLVQALGLQQGARVLDLGCGYGEVSANILAESRRRQISIELYLCDLHQAQILRISKDTQSGAKQIVVGDARRLPFPSDHFDSVVMKMALHEVPVWDQPYVCEQVLRVLRPGGAFVVWGVMPGDSELQDVFNKIMQVKNVLAGYESLVRDRYFFRLDQLLHMLTEAGFEEAQELRQVHFRQSTLARRDSELGGSDEKLGRLNAYCRAIISPELARRIDLTDSGDDIQFTVSNYIVSGRKPQWAEQSLSPRARPLPAS